MNINKFYHTKEKLFLGILFLAALASFFFFINFRTLAFPEHNIKFEINREQAAEKAKGFVSDLKYNPGDFKETTIFSIDNQTKTYLEREVGVSETAKLAERDVDVWHFTTRFFKPLEKEEISVAYLPNGRFAGYSREIEEAVPGARLSKALAQMRAEQFLTKTVHENTAEWKLVSGESIVRTARVDHTFIWEKNNFRAKEATYRMEVHVYGDQIGGYIEYLKIPENWLRAYEKETSNNDLAQIVAESLMILVFGLAILITFILEYRRNNVRLTSLRIFGAAAAIIAILTAFNSFPLSLAGYPTTISWEAFIGSVVLISLVGGIFEGASVFLIIAAGEARFRQAFPHMQSLESSIRNGLKTKEVNIALFVGVFAGIIFFTYELLYYFLGKQIGFWAPAEINYADMFSTVLPWLYPLFIGFSAAATEEGIFRLFGIPFLKKYVKSTWVAIFITAIVWGFLHSNYPQSPWFVRGIEITVIGVVLGWLFVRFGFLASFTAHYTFNALQTAIYFFASGSLYASGSSMITALLPLLIAIVYLARAIRRRGFEPMKKELLNSDISVHKPEEKKAVKVQGTKYQPLSRRRKSILIGLSLVSIAAFAFFYPKTSIDQVPVSLSRGEIKTIAEKTVAARIKNTGDFKQVTTFTPKDISLSQDYILEKSDFKTLRKIYPDKLPIAYWSVRYFKPLQKEEFIVDILPDGKVYQVVHILDEKAVGANLSSEDARKFAENYLKSEKGYILGRYKLVENKAEKKDKRTDHNLVYEEKGTKIGDATFRTEVTIKGTEVSGFDKFINIPENWLRSKFETTTVDFAVGSLIGLFAVILISFGFKTFLNFVRDKQLNFKLAYTFGAVVTVFTLIATLNTLSTFYGSYNTAIPLSSYTIQSVLGVVLGLVFSFLSFSIVIGMFIALWKQHIGQIIPVGQKERWEYFKDALIAGYSVPIILTAVSSALLYVVITYNLLKTVATFDTFPQLDSYFPFIALLAEFPVAIGGACIIAIGVLLLRKYLKSWKWVLLSLFVSGVLAGIPQQHMLDDMLTSISMNIILLTGGILVVKLILRKNMLSYFFMLYSSLFLSSGWVLFVQEGMFFKINGIVLLILAVLPLVLLFKNKFKDKGWGGVKKIG